MKSLTNLLAMLMIILGVTFIAIAATIAAQIYLEKIDTDDLQQITAVLSGKKKLAITPEELIEYQDLKKEKAGREKAADEAAGGIEARKMIENYTASQLQTERERHERILDLIKIEQSKLDTVRAELQSLVDERKKIQTNIELLKQQQTTMAQSQNAAKLRSIIGSADPEIIAEYFSSIPAQEAARLIREYTTPNIIVQVFEEMDAAYVNRILPLLENEYSATPPDEVVRLWKTPGTKHTKTPAEMAVYFRHLSVEQAFSIFRLLNEKDRQDLVYSLLDANPVR